MEVINKQILHKRLQEALGTNGCCDIRDMPSFEAERYIEHLERFEEENPYSKIMKSVPHLKLNLPTFDAEQAKAEIETHIGDDFVPINLRNTEETLEHSALDHPYWYARTLINYTPDSRLWTQKQSKECATRMHPDLQPYAASIIDQVPRLNLLDMKYYKTDLYDKLSYITKYIFDNIADETYRIFVWKIGKEGYLNWHNHAKLPWHKDLIVNDKAIVHLPIVSDPKIRMLVKIEEEIYSEYYQPGNSYVFNNIQDHAVDNPSDVNRIHVVAFIPWNDPKFEKVLERSLNA